MTRSNVISRAQLARRLASRAAAPAPIIAGKLAEHSLALPYWVAAAVLGAGVLVFLAFGHIMAAGHGERVVWHRWNRRAQHAQHTPEEAVGEAY
ncbi:hypothetical protein ACFQ1L_20380 [Phytohabitans flavus]